MAELLYFNKLLQFPSPFLNSRFSLPLNLNHSSFHNFSPLRRRCRGISLLPILSSPPKHPDLLLISTSVQSDGSLVFKFSDEGEIPPAADNVDGLDTMSDDAKIVVKLETQKDNNLAIYDQGIHFVSNSESDVKDGVEVKDSPIELPKSSIENYVFDTLLDDVEIEVELETESDQSLAVTDHASVIKLENDAEHDIEAKGFGIEVLRSDEIGDESASGSLKDEQNLHDLVVTSEIEDFRIEDSKLDVITESAFDVRNLESKVALGDEEIDDEESVKDVITERGFNVGNLDIKVAFEDEVIDDKESVKEVITESCFYVENLENELGLEDKECDEEESVKDEMIKDVVDEVIKEVINRHNLVVALEIKDSIVEDRKVDMITESGFNVSEVALQNVDEVVEEEMDLPVVHLEADPVLDEEANDTVCLAILQSDDSTGSRVISELAEPGPESSGTAAAEANLDSVQITAVEVSVPSAIGSLSQAIEVDDASIQQSDGDLCSDIDVAANPWPEISSTAEITVPSVPNREESSVPILSLVSAAASLANPAEALSGGDDAYFVCENWLGVADGVGQWSFRGIDKGLYAQEFIQNCERLARKSLSTGLSSCKELLQQSTAMTQSSGAARVLIAHISDQVLHVAYIGDSGFIVIRNGTVFKKSCPMFHAFNFPHAISSGYNPTEAAEEYCVELEEGDIIVMATDGLFDNLYEHEIASSVYKAVEDGKDIKDIAELLARRAQEVGRSPYARTPFADAAQAAGHTEFSGGKFDHVTIIVSLLEKERVV